MVDMCRYIGFVTVNQETNSFFAGVLSVLFSAAREVVRSGVIRSLSYYVASATAAFAIRD